MTLSSVSSAGMALLGLATAGGWAALAGLAQAIGVGAILGSWGVVLYALVGAAVWNRFARPAEERDLAERFGEPYERYRAKVPCWRPALRPYRA